MYLAMRRAGSRCGGNVTPPAAVVSVLAWWRKASSAQRWFKVEESDAGSNVFMGRADIWRGRI